MKILYSKKGDDGKKSESRGKKAWEVFVRIDRASDGCASFFRNIWKNLKLSSEPMEGEGGGFEGGEENGKGRKEKGEGLFLQKTDFDFFPTETPRLFDLQHYHLLSLFILPHAS